ncbi:MAG: single-stranded DNA-binding protein [Candidatus Odinarchaeota archaeon]
MSDIEPTILRINELKPFAKRVEVTFKVMNKGDVREIVSKKSGETHYLSDTLVADSTGSIILTLWDRDIDAVEENKVYKLSNSHVIVFQGSMRLSKGRFGEIKEADETIDEINLENNVSDIHVDTPRPRRRFSARNSPSRQDNS